MEYRTFYQASKAEKDNWYKLIMNDDMYLDYCGNLYEFSYGEADYDDTKYWHFQDINNGDEIRLKPITIFNNESIGFATLNPIMFDETSYLYSIYADGKTYAYETQEEAEEALKRQA